jgi:outer membrane protein assembly factor BamB
MKARAVVLVVGITAVLALGGYAAWQSSWVRSWFARDSADPAEIERARKEKPENLTPAATAAGSPQWRGATRLGVAPAGPFRTDWDRNPPKELWRYPIGAGYGSCAVVGGKLYVQDRQGENERVVCIDAESGTREWEHAYAAGSAGNDRSMPGPRATPSVDRNVVYTVGGDGKVFALEPEGKTAKVKWQHDLVAEFGAPVPQWGVACSPLVLGDLVIVQPGAKGAAVVAFDKATGEVRWKTGSNPPGYSSPAVGDIGGEPTLFAFMGDALLALRPSDGKALTISRDQGRKVEPVYPWKTQHNGNIATPLVVGNYVFISAAYGAGCALLRGEKVGDEVRLVEVYAKRRDEFRFQNHHATSVYKDGHLFGIDGQQNGARLKCVRFEDGTEVEEWKSNIGQSSLLLAGDYLILQTEGGDLCVVAADPKEFKLLARIPKVLSGNRNWASPTLVDGRIYLRDEQNVVCLDVRP